MKGAFWAGVALCVCLASSVAVARETTEDGIVADPAGETVPQSLVFDDLHFHRVGCARRELLWQDIYVLSLYSGPKSARLLRMDVVYGGHMPDGLPKDWRPALLKVISQKTFDTFNEAFANLQKGDSVTFTYLPGPDKSQVLVNNQPKVEVPGIALYDTIQNMWLGQDPISKRMKNEILGNVCNV